jgi:hypothetical protein
MRDSERYMTQAEAVARLAARAESAAEKAVYLSIADGWRKLAEEAARHERQQGERVGREERSFHPRD